MDLETDKLLMEAIFDSVRAEEEPCPVHGGTLCMHDDIIEYEDNRYSQGEW